MKYASLRQGLVGAWCPSLGPSGNTLLDRSEYGNHGTLTNMDAGTDWVGSQYGWALDFDGTNDQVTRAIAGILQRVYESNVFCVSLWCLVRSFSNSPVLWSLADSNVDSGLIEFNSTGSGMFIKSANETLGVSVARTYTLDATAAANTWHHIAFCKLGTGDNGLLYFNGRLQASYTGTLSTTVFGSVVQAQRFGSYSQNVAPLNGQMDDMRVYARVPTSNEIRLLSTEPGIGLKPERTSVFFGADLFSAAWLSRQSTIIGGGVA